MPRLNYTLPKLCTYEDDPSKPWFVWFDISDPDTGESTRKQFRGGINYYPTIEGRKKEGKALAAYWKKRLDEGTYSPFKRRSSVAPDSIKDAVQKVVDLKLKALKKSSRNSYETIGNMFIAWLDQEKLGKMKLYRFSKEHAQGYLDYLLMDKGYNGKTHNNQRSVLHAIFTEVVKRWESYMPKNPFTGIPELPEDIGKNLAYDEKEKKILINYFLAHDKRMYYAVNFIYHTYIRKTELCEIKVGNIDWENKTIRISSSGAKNRRQDSVTITDGLEKILLEMGLDLAPKEFYIFGKGMQTVAGKCNKPGIISERHRELKLAAGLPDDGKAYYSWKHTGVIDYYKQIKDIYAVMRQCRHSDLKTTMIYLKSLGLNPNIEYRKAQIYL
jgi:integrase